MGTVMKTQKTELYWASGPTAATKAVGISGITGLGGPADQIETTDLDNPEDKTFVGGLGTPGQVTLAFNPQRVEATQASLLALKSSKQVVSWGVYSSDAATAPTAVASKLQKVTGRASLIFDGFVSDITYDISGNNIWKGTITIQRAGPVVGDLNTP